MATSRDKLLSDSRSGARPLGNSPGAEPREEPRTAPREVVEEGPRGSQGSTGRTGPRGPAGPARTARREITLGGAARGGKRAVKGVTSRPGSLGGKHVLTAELLAGLLIVLVRVVADYEPQASGTIKGKVGHPKGQYGPLPIAAGLIGVFFLLSFFVAKGGRWGKAANAFGGLVILVLAVKSTDEFDTVAGTFKNWEGGKKPKGAWETTGAPPAGDPISTGYDGGGLVPGWGGGVAPKNPPPGPIDPHNGKCPVGYTLANGKCYPNVQGNPAPM